MAMAITQVLPEPVAILKAMRRRSSGGRSWHPLGVEFRHVAANLPAAVHRGLERDVIGALLHGPEQILTSLWRLQSHPAQYVSGIPSAAILLRISHPIRCSTRCLANVRARISGPMIAL